LGKIFIFGSHTPTCTDGMKLVWRSRPLHQAKFHSQLHNVSQNCRPKTMTKTLRFQDQDL